MPLTSKCCVVGREEREGKGGGEGRREGEGGRRREEGGEMEEGEGWRRGGSSDVTLQKWRKLCHLYFVHSGEGSTRGTQWPGHKVLGTRSWALQGLSYYLDWGVVAGLGCGCWTGVWLLDWGAVGILYVRDG